MTDHEGFLFECLQLCGYLIIVSLNVITSNDWGRLWAEIESENWSRSNFPAGVWSYQKQSCVGMTELHTEQLSVVPERQQLLGDVLNVWRRVYWTSSGPSANDWLDIAINSEWTPFVAFALLQKSPQQ